MKKQVACSDMTDAERENLPQGEHECLFDATRRAVQGHGTRAGEREALAAWHRSQGRVATAVLIETAMDESEE